MRIGQPFLARARSFAHSILAPMRRAADTLAADYSALRSRVLPTLNSFFFFFGKQFHYPLHGEKARIGREAAARPVSNSGEE